MIDFRYHLVSLISVFLALAIGVVLGAGPLQNSLGTALNDQVVSLREDRNATKDKLEQTEKAINDRDSYIAAAAQEYVPGLLKDRSIALVTLPGATGEDVENVVSELELAGATVSGRMTLTTSWVDASRDAFRSTYAGQFAGYMDKAPGTGNTVLGAGLATALTTSGAHASALTDLLTASDTPLMTVDAQLSAPADAIVVVGPRGDEENDDADTAPTPSPGVNVAGWTEALSGAAATAPVVVVGSAQNKTDVVAQLRTSQTSITTVDSVGQSAATVSTPLAVAQTLNGKIAAYGFSEGASAVMPPVTGGARK